MKIKLECDSISQIETKKDSNKVEITLINPIIEEYEEQTATELVDMIGREDLNILTSLRMKDYLEELTNKEILNHFAILTGIMNDRNILVTKESI